MSPVAARRTQQQRREGTIRKLLDAATQTLIDVGYAEASVQRICERAGVSQGALFRHFATREELMVAVGADVGARILEDYKRKFASAVKRNTDIEAALLLVRAACRSRLNEAWYELEVAARTNENLRKALEPVLRHYFTNITALARELLPDVATALGPSFDMLVTSIIMMFDGETTHRFLVRDHAVEEARLAYLVRGFELLQRQPHR
ncbi:MAG TPA: helix-turn-helix domain-containing protein [Kofleriaceae bacterium]|nr:helix-turn-helix domain-containing protein [Kofleriaceae bacterium]